MKHIVVTSIPSGELAANWSAFLADAPFATHYVTPNYFIDPYVGGERFAVIAIDAEGDIVAILTGVRSNDRITSGMMSRPQVVFRKHVNREKAIAALIAGLDGLGAKSVLTEIYAWEPLEFVLHGMRARRSGEETSIVLLDLAKGREAIFADFSQTRRNEIRRAEKLGLIEIKEPETVTEIEELYQIHRDWNARKGTAAGTLEQMQTAILQRGNRRVFIAKLGGKTIAGSFYRFCPGGVVEYAANFSSPEHQRLRPNDLLTWHAIQWACEQGFSHFSMGGASLFLRRFGGEIKTTFRYRRDVSPLRLNDLRENVRDLTVGMFQRLPEHFRASVRRILAHN